MSTISVRSILGALTNGMVYHVKWYLKDVSLDTVILHHETNDLKSGNASKRIATDRFNLALTVQNEKNKVFILGLTIRNDNFNKMTISIFGKKMFGWKWGLIDNQNMNLKMLNQSGLYLN